MKKPTSVPTMRDVAREAGVALGTVSKVVNGLPVGESYRIKVENAIKKLDYQVNHYAQGLKANKTYTIALLIPNTVEPFFAALVQHINQLLLQPILIPVRNKNTLLWHSKIKLMVLLD